MNTVADSLRKNPYFSWGLIALVLAVFAIVSNVQLLLLPAARSFLWLCTTGVLLLSALAFQWYLLRKRWLKAMTRFDLVMHRWIGVLATFLFALHASRVGHSWMIILTIVFVLTALTGLLNKEVVRFPARWMYLTWLALHVSMSTIMVPMIAVHVWVALAYQ
jgi:hypothetical protein